MQIDICMLNLLNSLANSYRLSGDPFGFSTSIIVLSTNNDSYFFLSNSHTICSNWISSILLKKVIVGILILFLISWCKLQRFYH